MSPTASDLTYQEMRDPRVFAVQIVALIGSTILMCQSSYLTFRLKSKFFCAMAVLVAFPMIVTDLAYFFTLSRHVPT
ncbi:hypothetical protein BC828DRAFT_14268 [Blastocladiella britannica]|nr:hypothetical protein BC828DRAFT_14268 [Blastocladiella britannica]